MADNIDFSTGLEVAKEFISGRTRRLLYLIVSIIGLTLSALTVGFGAAGKGIPTFIIVGLAVLGFLIGPFGQLAASNVNVPQLENPTEDAD